MKTFTLLILVAISILCPAQELVPTRHHPVEGSITYLQAANKASAFLTNLGLEPGDIAGYKVML